MSEFKDYRTRAEAGDAIAQFHLEVMYGKGDDVAQDATAAVRWFRSAADQGEGTAQNKILLRWKISDQNPAEKPVSLSYSANRSGPWEPITGWLPDTGSFVWTVTTGVPSKLYIRLVARDAIGNTSRVETPHPVLVDLKKPSARIVDIQAVERR